MTDLAKTISAKLANDYGLFPPMEWIEAECNIQGASSLAVPVLAFTLANRWQSRQTPIVTKVDP